LRATQCFPGEVDYTEPLRRCRQKDPDFEKNWEKFFDQNWEKFFVEIRA